MPGQSVPMTPGATGPELDATEVALGRPLTPEHRALLAEENGSERWYGEVFLTVYGTESLVAVNREIERHPGFLAFASDGSREVIGFDMRTTPPPVVMIDITSGGWEEALYQAASLTEFRSQRSAGDDLRWDRPYEPYA